MKFEIEVNQPSKREIEVEFPLFMKGSDTFDTGGWYANYYRIEADGTEYKVQMNDRGEWQFEIGKINLKRDLAYMLVEHPIYYERISKEKFYEKLDKLVMAIQMVPKP